MPDGKFLGECRRMPHYKAQLIFADGRIAIIDLCLYNPI